MIKGSVNTEPAMLSAPQQKQLQRFATVRFTLRIFTNKLLS